MPDKAIAPEKITRPVQLMAAWFAILTVLVGSFLTAAAKIERPFWVCGFLVVSAVALSVLVMLAVFLMLTMFRPHLQDSKEYAQWLVREDRERLTAERHRRAEGGQGLDEISASLEKILREGLLSQDVATGLHQASQAETAGVLADVAGKVAARINKAAFLSVDLTQIAPRYGTKKYPISAFRNLSDLLNEIYFSIQEEVEPYYYGSTWVLRRKSSKQILESTRMTESIPPGVPYRDSRTLAEVGITAGSELEAIRLLAR